MVRIGAIIRDIKVRPRNDRLESSLMDKKRYLDKQVRNALRKQKLCKRCHQKGVLEKHHIIPVSKGGGNEYNNIIKVCKPCHKILDKEALSEK